MITFQKSVQASKKEKELETIFLPAIGFCNILQKPSKNTVTLRFNNGRNKSMGIYITDPTYKTKYSIDHGSHIGSVINVSITAFTDKHSKNGQKHYFISRM